MTETDCPPEPPREALEFLRRLTALMALNLEPLEAVTLQDLQTNRILTLNAKGDWYYAGI